VSALRRLTSRLPLAAWLCVGVGLLNGAAWSLIVPPFHVPDEIVHFAYVQHLAETGDAPRHVTGRQLSDEEQRTLEALRFFGVVGNRDARPIWTATGERQLESVLDAGLDRVGDGASSTAVNNPPLFYALQVVPYTAASGGTLLDQVLVMRLLSVLLSALTVLAVFLFLREVFPGTPWAWTVGALAVAFQPLFAFISTGVNNDSGLYLVSAVLFLALARTLRHGLTTRRAAAIGAVVGLGLVTKLTFVAFVPAVALALLLLVVRDRADRGAALRRALVVAGVALVPVLVYLGLNQLWEREVYGGLSGGESFTEFVGRAGSLREKVSYVWQLYLPRLPFQADLFPGVPARNLWLNGLIGTFGWLDYGFGPGAYEAGFYVAVALGALATVGAVRGRMALWRRRGELAVYALAAVGLMVVIGQMGYTAHVGSPHPFEQARYLLPLLPLYAAVIVLAARGAGPRWGRVVGVAVVLLLATHGLLAQLLTLARYYG
jgi:4-amino-4-deoxy-L-arabinose transferase-like glycosyltransferase